jgi:uncharacterized protein YhaN
MKILSLNLIAFGPFSGPVLDLSAGKEGLHIVYGPNEAGKSSALRAIRQLLYGIPERSKDDFIHPYAKMRIGGALKSADGEVLEVIRRKGRSGTLRSSDDKTIVEESAIQRFLNGIDAALFAVMFGIGYEDLVTGGREIIQGRGDIGKLIFAAGSGAANLGAVVAELQAEADGLFRPSGQKQKINEAVGRLKQRRAELKQAQLLGQTWVQHDRALNKAQKAKAGLEDGLAAAQRSLSRLQRVKAALPVIASRLESLIAIEPVACAVLLPEGFGERRADTLTRLRVAQNGRDQAAENLLEFKKAFAELQDPSELLSHAETIEGVLLDLGSQRKAAKDRIAIGTRRSTLRTEARHVLRNLSDDLVIEQADRLRIKKQEAVRIQELGAEYERIATRIDGIREKIPEQEQALANAQTLLEALPKQRAVDNLKNTLAEVEEILPLEKQLLSVRSQAEELRQACNQSTARLRLTTTALEQLIQQRAPDIETVRLFEDRWDELDRRLTSLRDELRKNEAELAEIDRRLDETRLAQQVPTEEELAAVRKTRDSGWRLIKRKLQGEVLDDTQMREFIAYYADEDSLPGAFEASLRKSDETSDRLRREADRVAAKARFLADQVAFQTRLTKLGGEITTVQGEKDASTSEWIGLWQPLLISPRSPREMRQWVSDFKTLTEKAGEALKRESEARTLEVAIEGGRAAVAHCLQTLSEPFEPKASLSAMVRRIRGLIDKEEELGRQTEDLSRERKRLAGELESSKSRLKSLEQDDLNWQRQWAQAVQPLGLGAGTRPAEANAVMEELKGFFDKLREAEVLQQRIDGIDRDDEAFKRKVAALAIAVAPDLVGRQADEAAGELQRKLTAGREVQSKRQALQKQIDQEQVKLRKAESIVAEMEGLLNAMCEEAGRKDKDELPEAERQSSQRRQLEAQIRKEEEHLVQLGAGATVEAFIKEVSAVDPDSIDVEIERLKEEIGRLTSEKSELDQRIGSERTELGRMNGGDHAAMVAEQIQAIIGGLDRDVEHYARLKIAGRVLALAVERFREKSQGPILRKASEIFGRITCGSFEGLRADRDPEGNPVLVGVRQGGKETVPVEGMSDGTADQLYLALRLSGLEHYLDANEPMPFIVDDILIKFDNDRAEAALQSLAELSKRSQVIFFTHHRHLPDMAQKLIDPELFVIHELGV